MSRLAQICACGEHAWFALTAGYIAFVDPQMKHLGDQYSWHAAIVRKKIYVRRAQEQVVNGERRHWTVSLHQQIMCVPEGWGVDHRDSNGLNNRTRNLRPCTPSENAANAQSRPKSVTGFRKSTAVNAGEPSRPASGSRPAFSTWALSATPRVLREPTTAPLESTSANSQSSTSQRASEPWPRPAP